MPRVFEILLLDCKVSCNQSKPSLVGDESVYLPAWRRGSPRPRAARPRCRGGAQRVHPTEQDVAQRVGAGARFGARGVGTLDHSAGQQEYERIHREVEHGGRSRVTGGDHWTVSGGDLSSSMSKRGISLRNSKHGLGDESITIPSHEPEVKPAP